MTKKLINLVIFIFPILLSAQQFPDRLVLTNGKSYEIKLNEISSDNIKMSYQKGDMSVSFITIDSLSVAGVGLIYTQKSGFVSEDLLFKLKNVKRKHLKSRHHGIYMKSGEVVLGQLLTVTDNYLIAEVEDRKGNFFYRSFPKDSVLLVSTIAGKILYFNGALQVVDLRKYYTSHASSAREKVRYIEKYPRFGIELSLNSTITKLDDLNGIITKFSDKVGDMPIDLENNNVFNLVGLALIADINRYFSLSFNTTLDFTMNDNSTYILVFADVKYFPINTKFRPWIGAGYAASSIMIANELEKGTVNFTANPHGMLIGIGFECTIINSINLVGSYRYIPFYRDKIDFENEKIDASIDLETQHLAIGINLKF